VGRRRRRCFGTAYWSSGDVPESLLKDVADLARGTTVGEVYRKVMGDAPLGYVETVGGLKVSEDDVVMAGKNDVGLHQAHLRANIP
jgi:hypothetical protein